MPGCWHNDTIAKPPCPPNAANLQEEITGTCPVNPVTIIELIQVVGIAAAAMVGFMGVFAGVFIWAANVRDKAIERRL